MACAAVAAVAACLALTLAAAAASFVACIPPPLEPVGVSTSRPTTSHPIAPDAGERAKASVLPPDFPAAWTKISGVRFVSPGHGVGRYDADVFAKGPGVAVAGADGGANGGPSLGAAYVEQLFEHGSSRPGPTYMMERVACDDDAAACEGWRFVVGDARGALVPRAQEACAGCHAEAPRGGVFPLSR